ncbi:hypothetical protein BH10PSE14_BH10PSE14_27450 [soil metagenome]
MASPVHDVRYMAVIAQLRARRKELGLTQVELAARLGRRQQYVSKYESGERRLDIVEHLDVAVMLEIDAKEVWRELGLG